MIIPTIKPNWPAPKNIHAFSTTRQGGTSVGVYKSLNLSTYVGDHLEHVLKNRQKLMKQYYLPTEPLWLKQQHGTLVIDAATNPETLFADGSYSNQKNVICSVFTADCLPLLLCNKTGTEIAAIHAGWRGLLNGIIESGMAKFKSKPEDILVWLGPAIGPKKFEVGEEVKEAFLKTDPESTVAFVKSDSTNLSPHLSYLANIYELAKIRLRKLGITHIYGGKYCTHSNSKQFFSYRRDGQCGRMANLIWME